MGQVETKDDTLTAHAVNEGVTDTMLSGKLRFDSSRDGIAAVIDLSTVGKKTPMTDALKDMVVRTLRSRSLVVMLDGEEVRTDPPQPQVLRPPVAVKRLGALRKLPYGSPRLISQGETQ